MQLLQNGKNQWIDQNGLPLANGTVGYYAVGTLNPLTTYQDQAGTIQNTNPITLDSRGQAIVWGAGTYRQIVKDASGVTVWDQVVDAPAGGGALASTSGAGGAALVGFDGGTLAAFFLGKSNRVADSIAGLRALTKTTYTRAFVTGYYAAGDGGGGAYWYDSTDTTSADNGGTIIVAADGGRWKLQTTETVSIKQFGAKMDDATDDAVAIQAAINWAQSLGGGGGIYVPAGTARISAQINIPLTANKAFTMFGNGAMSRFRAITGITMFNVGGGSPVFGANVLLRDFTILQPVSGTGGTGVLLLNANSARLEGLDISNMASGVVMNASYNVRISGCRIYGCSSNGITTSTTGTNGTYIFNNVISTCAVGINLLVGGNNIVVRDNDMEACGISVGITNYTSVLIQGNYIENNTNTYLFFGGANYEIDITQNWFGANTTSTNFQNIVGGSFAGNTVWGATFTQSAVSDFIIGHNIIQNAGIIPTTAWTVPALLNSFSNFGSGTVDAGYIKDRQGFVHVRGTVTGPADAVIFTLPVGYRPIGKQDFSGVASNGTASRVSVFSDGSVTGFRGTDNSCGLGTVKLTAVNQ